MEVGVLGVALYMAAVVLMLRNGLKACLRADGARANRAWRVGCLTAFVSLLLHSLVDITFSYPLLLGLWGLLGVSMCRTEPQTESNVRAFATIPSWAKSLRISGMLLLIVIGVMSIRIGLSEAFYMQAEQMPDSAAGRTEAIQLLERSAALSPAPAMQHERIAGLLLQQAVSSGPASDRTQLKRAAEEASTALIWRPHHPRLLLLACQIEYASGNRAAALERLRELSLRYPFRVDIQEELRRSGG
ncbi:lipopolysaccharide assembly protein LapB [Paenibacillus sp. YYML68]|uniref:tetratricopeptide repeat protein n=1 Tax=Paenibacillus sp. YYML68 TaxID=2909250 RepID=UPI00249322F6|nr:hypothetical protein [Paenibacillus sp. YYML68]